MPKVEGVERLLRRLKGMSLKGKVKQTLVVGYSAPWAVYVHEDLEARHPGGGQAKYLEAPFRAIKAAMADAVAKAVRQKRSVAEGLLKAGAMLLAASQPLVPVASGLLKESGFVDLS